MTRTYSITLKDEKIVTFRDIVALKESQIKQVTDIAFKYTRDELIYDTKGFDIKDFTPRQQIGVLRAKRKIVYNKTPEQLRERKVITFSKHALERMLEREGSNSLGKQFEMIQKIIDADRVLKAQFKGNSSLTYTLTKQQDRKGYKFPISFKWVNGKRQILTVTLTREDAPVSQMSTKLGANQDTMNKMEEFKKKLKERNRNSP